MLTHPEPVHAVSERGDSWSPETYVDELSAELFAQLPRSDQRVKGWQYLHGLLTAEGRKSVRNIAARVGDRASEQSLHHFISSSTWEWEPVRAALVRHLERVRLPRAWVVKSVVIPKAGDRTVGVGRRFVPGLGQFVNSQVVYGLWNADEHLSSPVNWRVLLSEDWRETVGQGCARIRELPLATSPLECVAGAAEELRAWSGSARPVVLGAVGGDPGAALRRFRSAGLPLVTLVRGTTEVVAADRALPTNDGRAMSARELLWIMRSLRRPVEWTDPATLRPRTSTVAAIRVELPGHPRPLVLFGDWGERGNSSPQRCWLTDMTESSPGSLLRLTKLTRRVETDFDEVSEQVGLTDYEGRSFAGWHRHTTLASTAHAARVLARSRSRTPATL